MSTVRELVTDAFSEAGILAQGESLSAEDGAYALRKLNRLIESWSADGILVYKKVQESLTVSASGSTIGTSQTLNTEAPIQIESAKITVSDIDYDVELINSKQYADIASKAQTGRPTKLYYEGRGTGAKIYLWPAPDQSYSLKLFSTKKIASFTGLSDSVTVPAGYERMIVSNLAVDLCGQAYGVSATGEMIKAANDSYAACARSAFTPVLMKSDLASSGQFDINTGEQT
jgi:hypothetical protein